MIRTVEIHYRRPPDRVVLFRQLAVHEGADVVVTYQPETPLQDPVRVDGQVVLEPGAPAVWFTFPGAAHDIGRFHLRDGTFTGIYANVLTPVEVEDDGGPVFIWRTTDLYLDVFLPPDGPPRLLDLDELEAAVAAGDVDEATAARARAEADRLIHETGEGTWPPPVVREWTLARARSAAGL